MDKMMSNLHDDRRADHVGGCLFSKHLMLHVYICRDRRIPPLDELEYCDEANAHFKNYHMQLGSSRHHCVSPVVLLLFTYKFLCFMVFQVLPLVGE